MKCNTCQKEATEHINSIDCHFCKPCLTGIDARLQELVADISETSPSTNLKFYQAQEVPAGTPKTSPPMNTQQTCPPKANTWFVCRDGELRFVGYRCPVAFGTRPWRGNDKRSDAEAWYDDGSSQPHGPSKEDLISEQREPKLRPWKEGEIPVGAIVRHKDCNNKLITIAWCDGIRIGLAGGQEKTPSGLITHEWSWAGPNHVWKPCGVVE